MANLLRQLAGRGTEGAFVQRLLSTLDVRIAETGRGVAPKPPVSSIPLSLVDGEPLSPPARDTTGGLVEPLTEREMEVLVLLEERLTNQEIAQRLVIALPTVKRHASNIYAKLNVRNRREAVDRARELGIASSG
jgi:LuxR family maltose regulon positive regulatory protein